MQIKLKALSLALPMLFTVWAHADIEIYPSKGIFGLEQGCRADPNTYEANGSSIVCDFSQAIDNDSTRQQAEQIFLQSLKQNFGDQVVATISQKNKHRTYVASLEVLRASEYVVKKDSTAEIFLPVTLSLKLTNILSGEVIYSDSATLSQPIQVLSSELESAATKAAIKQKFQSTLLTLTQQVAQGLKSKLNVAEIETKVIDQWKSYLVLDKGFNQGIAAQDELSSAEGDLIRIVHADSDYAVALPVLMQGNAKQFSKISTNTRQAMNKPKALVVDVLTYQGESKDLIEQIFSDAVGEQASFSLTPVNRRYSAMAQSISEQTSLAQSKDINQRDLPEFFIRINVIPVIAYQQQIGKMTQQQVFHSEVFAEMIDRSGRVIYSAHATDDIKDIVSEGMGFSLEARKEVALKNALLQLGQKFQKGLQFTRADLKVSGSSGQSITIDDAGERLSAGMKVHVYHQDKAAQRNILIPTWEATIVERQGTKVSAQLDFPISSSDRLPVRSGDRILIDSSAPVGDSKQARVLCPGLHTDQVGEIPFYGFGPLIYHAFSSQSKRPFYATGAGFKGQTLLKDAVIRMTENSGFKKNLDANFYVPKDECLQPVFKIEVKENSVKCNADKSNCDATLIMASGARRFNAKAEKVGAYGLQQEIGLKGIAHLHRQEMYNIQMFEALPKILNQIVQKADSTQ
ncbi:hypothetical protein B9T26_03170 [Acinetobacter sp. ANC 4169]|jgi:hypothetical protein|uniref:hypothetical protein n=1 Tax=Acinetobacter sp. ANC 4169 TaxID=1977879 RepID=UPI000A34139E|nr:hypothetical protein [Acinetobacter sp. ANC 4169]OTG76111.1 hypothetical protein B9T26_03170 [Acinetobacter sp. ANC 4169]